MASGTERPQLQLQLGYRITYLTLIGQDFVETTVHDCCREVDQI